MYIVKGGKRPLHGLSGGPELHIPLLGTRMREAGGEDRRTVRAGADPAFEGLFGAFDIMATTERRQGSCRGRLVADGVPTGPQQRCGQQKRAPLAGRP